MPIRDKTIDDVVDGVDRFGTVPKDQVQAVVAVVARCTIELGEQMAELSRQTSTASSTLGAQLSELTSQIEGSRTEMKGASASATRQAEALVKWTRVLVCVTAAYTILTAGLLIAAIVRG